MLQYLTRTFLTQIHTATLTLSGLLAHLQPQNENAVLFVTRHLSEKEENDTMCWYLLTR